MPAPPSASSPALSAAEVAAGLSGNPASSSTEGTSPAPGAAAGRYPGLDWLRALASVLVVVLHAGMPYMTSPMPGLVWCTEDRPARTAVVDALGWGIDTFVMPLFFLIGGFLACQSCSKAGPWTFFKNRSVRLGLPFVVAFVLIMPADFYVWLLGWVCEERIVARKMRSLKFDGDLGAQLKGPGHLWFLQYMWLFCAGAAALLHLWTRRAARPASLESPVTIRFPRSSRFPTWRLATVASLFLVSVAGLYWKPQVVIGFQQAILPQLPNILYYAPCFALGWCIQHWRWKPASLWGPALLALSLAAFPFAHQSIARHVLTPLEGVDRLLLVTAFTLCGWLAATGLFAWGIRSSAPAPRWISYLSGASLWIYLAHHPFVGLTQISLRPMEGSGAWKCAVATAVGLALSLLTYEAMIRGRWLDTILNGAKRRLQEQSPSATPLPSPAARVA